MTVQQTVDRAYTAGDPTRPQHKIYTVPSNPTTRQEPHSCCTEWQYHSTTHFHGLIWTYRQTNIRRSKLGLLCSNSTTISIKLSSHYRLTERRAAAANTAWMLRDTINLFAWLKKRFYRYALNISRKQKETAVGVNEPPCVSQRSLFAPHLLRLSYTRKKICDFEDETMYTKNYFRFAINALKWP
jgi:hypothetical protein